VSCEALNWSDIFELRGEAAEARCLAVKFQDRQTVSDLLNYAAALEGDANLCEQAIDTHAHVSSNDNSWRPVQTIRQLTFARH